jgi:hypothetical protein
MKGWPPKDWLALIALFGSIAGAAVLTALVWWGSWMLMPAAGWWTGATEADRAQTLRWVLWGACITIGLVMLGLGFAISRRSFKGSLGPASFDMQGGEDDPATGRLEVPPVGFGSGAAPK